MISQLDTFICVVEEGGYTRAARYLYKSPSAISKQIAALENELGVKLFKRSTRTMLLTDAGHVFYRHCCDIKERVGFAKSEARSAAGNLQGQLKISWPPGLSYSVLSRVLAQFTNKFPGVTLSIEATNDVLNLREKGIDIAFRSAPKDYKGLVGIELFTVEPLICASPKFLNRCGPVHTLSELAEIPNLLPTYMNFAQKSRAVFPELARLKPEEHHISNDLSSILNLCKAGVGSAFLFRHVVADALQSGDLVNVFPDASVPKVPVFMLYPATDFMPARIRAFVDFVKAYFLHAD